MTAARRYKATGFFHKLSAERQAKAKSYEGSIFSGRKDFPRVVEKDASAVQRARKPSKKTDLIKLVNMQKKLGRAIDL